MVNSLVVGEALAPVVEIKEAEITLLNEDELKDLAKQVKEKYDGLVVVDDETYRSTKDVRATINKLIGIVNRNRIDIARQAKKPIDEFEGRMKAINAILEESLESVVKPIEGWETKLRDDRQVEIDEIIKQYGQGYDIEIKDRWFNKTMTIKKIVEDVQFEVSEIERQEEARKKHIESIEVTCQRNNLTPEGYLHLLSAGVEVFQILNQINADGKEKQAREAYNAEVEEMQGAVSKDVKKPQEVPKEPEQVIRQTVTMLGTPSQFKELMKEMKRIGIRVDM